MIPYMLTYDLKQSTERCRRRENTNMGKIKGKKRPSFGLIIGPYTAHMATSPVDDKLYLQSLLGIITWGTHTQNPGPRSS